jgi:hypothetical protein
MWPFKKKKPADTSAKTFNTILCIPGIWPDKSEIINSIFSVSNGEFAAIGDVLLNPKTGRFYNFEVRGHDENMKTLFREAGEHTKTSEEFPDKIEQHNFVIYLSGATGSFNEAYLLSAAAAFILEAGGIGVKIDTTGKAFEKTNWLANIQTYDEANLFEMFVINSISDYRGSVWSCGMQNLGLKDTIISGADSQKSVDAISIFGYHQIFDKPVIKPGQTFQQDARSAKYAITTESNQPFKGNKLLENPFGMWRLTPIAEKKSVADEKKR